MIYLISKSFDNQRDNRVKFIQELIRMPLYFRNNFFKDFYLYQTFPFKPDPNICLVFGHNNEVANLLKENSSNISEQNIFIISCAVNYIDDYNVPDKNIYLSPQIDDEYVRFRKGSDYHFEFDVTDVEIYLAQSEENDILKKFKSCFDEIYHNVKE